MQMVLVDTNGLFLRSTSLLSRGKLLPPIKLNTDNINMCIQPTLFLFSRAFCARSSLETYKGRDSSFSFCAFLSSSSSREIGCLFGGALSSPSSSILSGFSSPLSSMGDSLRLFLWDLQSITVRDQGYDTALQHTCLHCVECMSCQKRRSCLVSSLSAFPSCPHEGTWICSCTLCPSSLSTGTCSSWSGADTGFCPTGRGTYSCSCVPGDSSP